MFKHLSLDRVYQFLLIILAFLMPLTVFGANLIIVLISFTWLLSGKYKSKFQQIFKSKILIASIVFFSLHVIGLAWTEDLDWGIHIVHKMWYFVGLFPILYSVVKFEHTKFYISSFLLAISFSELVSYLIWFEVIQPFKYASAENPTPFMSHISYNPILAVAIYIVVHKIFFSSKMTLIKRFFYSFFALTMTVNMFITGGRAGQVMFFAVIIILILQYFNTSKIKGVVIAAICSASIFFAAFNTSPIFHSRVISAVENIQNFEIQKNTSVGERITFTLNSIEIIKNNPIFGVGTGDFPSEYKKINSINSPTMLNTSNPHNMYVLILTQLGAIGLLSFLTIFFFQIKFAISTKNKFNHNFGIALPILYLLILFSDSYLLGHYTSLIFIFFSSFLYKDFEKS